MTSPSDVWVQSVCATDMWGQVYGQYGLGPNWALVGSGWAGLGRTCGKLWRCHVMAVGSTGLRPQLTGVSAAHGGPGGAGPWTADRSTVDRVHPPSLRRGPCAPSVLAGGRRGGCSPIFPAAVLLPTASSLRASCGSAGVRLGRGKASSRCGDCVGGVKVAVKASQGAGHDERRLELHRRAGMVRVLRHRPILWCVWATLCSSGHVGQVEGSSRASGGFGHGGGLLQPWRRSGARGQVTAAGYR